MKIKIKITLTAPPIFVMTTMTNDRKQGAEKMNEAMGKSGQNKMHIIFIDFISNARSRSFFVCDTALYSAIAYSLL